MPAVAAKIKPAADPFISGAPAASRRAPVRTSADAPPGRFDQHLAAASRQDASPAAEPKNKAVPTPEQKPEAANAAQDAEKPTSTEQPTPLLSAAPILPAVPQQAQPESTGTPASGEGPAAPAEEPPILTGERPAPEAQPHPAMAAPGAPAQPQPEGAPRLDAENTGRMIQPGIISASKHLASLAGAIPDPPAGDTQAPAAPLETAAAGTTPASGPETAAAARPLPFSALLAPQETPATALPGLAGPSQPAPSAVVQGTATEAPPSPAQPARAIPAEAVPMTIATLARDGARSFDIRLDPAELGRIEVSITVDREGAVRTHMIVERPETLQLLRNDAPRLEQAMSDAGLKPEGGGVSLSLKQGNGQNTGEGAPQRTPVSHGEAKGDAPAAQEAARHYRTWSAASRLDLVL